MPSRMITASATASSGSEPGIELTYWSLQLGDDVLASGGFGPQGTGVWEPLSRP